MKGILSIAFFLLSFGLSAQKITVLNEDNNPLIGATIILKTINGEFFYSSTDLQGNSFFNTEQFRGGEYLFLSATYIGYDTFNDTLFHGVDKTIRMSPKPYLIDDVVVTAQYSPTSIENSVHKIKVIDQQKIENMAAVNLRDVLTNELNVRLAQDNILGTGMSLQGINGQNVKILIDGVPVIGRLNGEIDLNQINLNNVERIEIVEGPLSVNYGSNALAGTINIITKKEQKEKLHLGLNTYTESIGTYNIETNIGYSPAENHSLNLSIGRNYFDGWNPEDDFFPSFSRQRADSGRVNQWNPKEQYFGRLQYNYKYRGLLLSYKGEFLDETITNYGFPRETRTSIVAFDDYYHTQRIDNALFAQGNLNKKWSVNWTAAYNDYERVKEALRKDLVTQQSNRIPEDEGNDQQDTSTFNLLMSRGSIASTRDSSWLNYELGYDVNVERASGKRIDGGEQELGDYAGFASAELRFTEDITLKPAIRYSYNTKYDAPITPSVNLKYTRNNSTLRISYAKGFRAPSLKELYFNFDDVNHSLFGNPNLKAEQSHNYSASIRHKFLVEEVLLKAEISGFYNKIFNQINFAQSNFGGGDTLVYFNVGENQTKGLNLNFSAALENIKLNFGSSYIGRYNRLSDENPIDKFSYSMEFVANVTYELKKPQLTLAVFGKHQGELPQFGYDSEGVLVKQTIESYQIVDVTLSRKFFDKKMNVALGCKNILNVQNVRSTISGGAHNNNGGSRSVGTGRMVFLKIGMNIKRK